MGLVISSVNSIFNIEETPEDTNQNEQSRNGSEMENDVPEAMMPTANKFKPIKIKQELHIANVQSRCEDSSDKEQSTEQFDYSSADRGTALQVNNSKQFSINRIKILSIVECLYYGRDSS